MKLTSEQFNKLPQLDRIEFRQKFQNINKHWESDLTTPYVTNFIIVTFGVLIIIPLYYHVFGVYLYSLINLSKFFGFLVVSCILIDIICYLKSKIELRKLEEQYFNILPKK